MGSVAIRGGHSSAGEPDGKHLVLVIDPNHQARAQVAEALTSFYRIAEFADIETAVAMLSAVPSLAVVDERARPYGSRPLIRSMRGDPVLAGVPIVLCVSRNRAADPGAPPDDKPAALLEKPFRRSDLVGTISGLLNHAVEAAWQKLPERPQAALRQTLAAYTGILDLIEKGEPLAYEDLNKSCAPLVEAVAASEHKEILKAVRRHDNYGYVHSLRVATLLALFGITIGLKDEALLLLACGGMMHDIGKLTIPFELLNKQGDLTPDERITVRSHVDKGVAYLKRHSNVPKGLITIASQHHERLDGSGYPEGLGADRLNDLARMAAIVDVFAALTDRRSYKPAMTPEHALAIMTEEMAAELDQRLVRRFREMLMEAAARKWA